MCNPHDLNSIKEAMMRAVEADRSEAAKRMQSMRRFLRDHGGRRWAANFLAALNDSTGSTRMGEESDER
jgi:trehalose 6-phosphate synthase